MDGGGDALTSAAMVTMSVHTNTMDKKRDIWIKTEPNN